MWYLFEIIEDFFRNFYIQFDVQLINVEYDLNVVLYQRFDVQQNYKIILLINEKKKILIQTVYG
jgi:hypothetical protein